MEYLDLKRDNKKLRNTKEMVKPVFIGSIEKVKESWEREVEKES